MSAPGLLTGSSGYIQNPTQLLQRIEDGLSVFNETPDPLIDLLSEDHFELETSVDQAPSDFEREGEGSLPGAQKLQWRDLKFPLETFDMRTSWTKTGLEDSREDRVLREANAAMKGWAVREVGLLAAAIFRNRTAGAIGTAYEASFYNGETDVPPKFRLCHTAGVKKSKNASSKTRRSVFFMKALNAVEQQLDLDCSLNVVES